MAIDIIRLHPYHTSEGSMIAISFPMSEPCKSIVKQLTGRRWCDINKWIYVRNTAGNLQEIFSRFKGKAFIDCRDYFNQGVNCRAEVRIVNSIQKKRTYIHFTYGAKPDWIDWIKKIQDSHHIIKTGDWSVPGNNENYLMIKRFFHDQGCQVKIINIDKIQKAGEVNHSDWYKGKPFDSAGLQEYSNMLSLKRVSVNTSKIYLSMFKRFLAYFHGQDVSSLTKKEITKYLLWEIQRNGISITLQNQMINAIKYYYENVLGRAREIYDLPRPKFGKPEPVVLNNEELHKILTGELNLKHRCIVSLIFSAGLRRHELINLKIQDIDIERKVITIHNGKGNKDRISLLAETTVKHIQEYVAKYKPRYWLIEGQYGGKYSAESIWKIFNRLKKRYNIEKKGNVHLLRHTFATNLIESGTDIRLIQKLLGHSSLKTTEIYTHIANNRLLNIKSPIDNLGI